MFRATLAEIVKDKPKLAEIRKIIERAKKASALPRGKIVVSNEN